MKQTERALRSAPAGVRVALLNGCNRRGLLSTTALQAVAVIALVQPAQAQLAPNARPTGGQVVAGQASIAQTAGKTTITQTSQNAAVNWQNYNVGSAQTVQYVDPSSRSMTLNRVVGPNPSEIAGRINSNGIVLIVNQAGLLFDGSAQINTAGLVVSAAGISNSNFMAGKLVFDQAARPGAKIENRGTITIKNEGLAALVAPQVVNSGVIRARLGKVILAGAEASTLDLYGDGMVSINVTKQVATAPDGNAALVTNTGVVTASGGTVLLTAQAVDGVVQTLVNAGGRISANSVAGHTGRVVVEGAGGDVVVTGAIAANGHAPGTTGGSVVLNTTGGVALASTARVSASGPAGGGTIAIGTTLKRAAGGPSVSGQKTAKAVSVAPGAKIAANATQNGTGGRVTVLSTDQTTMAGTINARGGALGGDGGFVEVSGQGGFALTGMIDVSAASGLAGTILLDPANLVINSGTAGTGSLDGTLATNGTVTFVDHAIEGPDTVSSSEIELLHGNIVLQAQTNLSVASNTPITFQNNASLTFETQTGNISTGTLSPITASGTGAIIMLAGTLGSGATISLGSDLTTDAHTGSIKLQSDAGIGLNNIKINTGTLDLSTLSSGGVTQTGGTISGGTLVSSNGIAGTVLLGASNTIATIGSVGVTNGDFILVNTGSANVTGPLTANNVTLSAGSISVPGSIGARNTLVSLFGTTEIDETGVINAGTVSAHTGTVALSTGTDGTIALSGSVGAGRLIALSAGTLGIGQTSGLLNAGTVGTVSLAASGHGMTQSAGGAIGAGTLISGSTLVGTVTLAGTANAIATIGAVGVTSGDFNLVNTGSVEVAGPLTADNVTLSAGSISVPGSIGASSTLVSLLGTTGIAETGVINAGAVSAHTGTVTLSTGTVGTIALSGSIGAGRLIALSAGTLGIGQTSGLLNAGTVGTLSLAARGQGVTQSGGSIDAGTLISGSTLVGTVTLPSATNAIGTVGAVAMTSGDFNLVDSGTVVVAGPLVASNVTLSAGSIAVPGSIGASSTLVALFGTTGIDESGVINAGTVSAHTGTVTLSTGTAGAIALSGSIGAGTLIALSAGTLGISQSAGLLNAGTVGTLSLSVRGHGVTQSGGSIDAGTLVSGSTLVGTVTLPSAANAIASIGSFAVPSGDFNLLNAGTVAITGPLTANNVTVTAGGISVTGTVSASDTLVAMFGTTGIGESDTGTILANAGSVTLGTGPAGLMTLAGSVGAGTLIALSAGTLTQSGTVQTTGTSSAITEVASSGDFTFSGLTRAGSGGVTLQATAAAFTQTGGTITAANGTVDITAGTSILQSGGVIETTGSVGPMGILLTSNGTGANGITQDAGASIHASDTLGTVDLVSAGTVALAGTILATDPIVGTIGVAANGGTLLNAGILTAGTHAVLTALTDLTNSGTVTVSSVGGLASLTARTGTLTQSGTVQTRGTIALSGSLGIELPSGLIDTGTSGTISLASTGGGVQQAATSTGTIITGTLISGGTIAQGVSLLGTNNTIGTIGPFMGDSNIQIVDASSLTIAPNAVVQTGTGDIYLDVLNGGTLVFGAHGTIQVLGAGGTIGLQTDFVQNLGTAGATGTVSVIGGTFELAPNTTLAAVSLGTVSGLSLATLDGIFADRVRIGAVTLPGDNAPTITAGTVAIGGASGFDALNPVNAPNVLELDAIADVGQTQRLQAITLTGTAGSFTLGNTLNIVGTIGLASAGGLGSLHTTDPANGAIVFTDATNLTILGDVTAGPGGVTIAVPNNTLTLNGEVVSAQGNVSLSAGTISLASADGVDPVVAAGALASLSATTVSQTAGVINAGTVTIAATGSADLTGGLIVANLGTIGITSPSISVNAGETIATAAPTQTSIFLASNVTQAAASLISASGDIQVNGGLTQNGGVMVAGGGVSVGTLNEAGGSLVSNGLLSLGSLQESAGLIASGQDLTIGNGAGSSPTSGAFTQTGGALLVSGAANIFTTGTFLQSGGVLATGGTLGVTAGLGIDIAGTVSAAGPTGYMLLANAGEAVIETTGLLSGPAVTVNGDSIIGNGIQAPAGTVLIAGRIGRQVFDPIGPIAIGAPGVYTLIEPGVTLATLTSQPSLIPTTVVSLATLASTASPSAIPIVLIGSTVDIESLVPATVLGLYAQSSIVEGAGGAITANTLTGSAGVLNAGTLAPGLTALNWTTSALGWNTGTVDILGSVSLNGSNHVGTLADFAVTRDFSLTNAQSLLQIGTLQVGSALSNAYPSQPAAVNTTTIAVDGQLTVNGVIATGIDDGNVRPGGNTFLSASSIVTSGTIAAVPSGASAGGIVGLNAVGALTQNGGVINGGNVALAASAANLSNGMIVATQGTIGIIAPTATVSANEIIAALNTATGIGFSGNVIQAASSYIGSNGDVTVGGLLTENGGVLLAVGNVSVGSLSQTAGTIADGAALSIGQGNGVAGWTGSSATSGTFSQSGGLLASGGAANIFTTGAFVQGAGGVLATGGSLGVTANQGIDIAGTVAAAGPSTGFMLLANAGNAILETTGLLGGAALTVPGDAIPGDALQAPAGTVRIAGTSGTQAFARAGAVGPIAAVAGYQIAPPASPPTVPRLLAPTVGAPDTATATAAQLTGGTIDIERPVTASTLGLFATTSITEGPAAIFNLGRLTGSSGADVNFLSPGNSIGTLGSFNDTGHAFALVDASNLMLTGLLSANSVRITDATNSIDLTGTVLAATSAQITAGGSIGLTGLIAANSGTLKAGGPINLSGLLSASNTATLSAGGSVDLTGTVSAPNSVEINAGSSVAVAGVVSAGSGTIVAGGPINLSGVLSASNTATLSAGGSVDLTGTVSAPNSVEINAGSSVAVAGVVSAGSGTIVAGGPISLAGLLTATNSATLMAGSSVDLTGTLLATNGVQINARGPISLAGLITAGSGTVTTDGPISLAGMFSATNGATLSAGTSIDLTGTLATANNAQINAGSSVALAGVLTAATGTIVAGGPISLGGIFSATNGATLSAGSSIDLTGALSTASNAQINAGDSVAVGGVITANTGTIVAGGPISLSGRLSASDSATLSAGSSVDLTGALLATNKVNIAIPGSGIINLAGMISGGTVQVDAPLGSITLAKGSAFSGIGAGSPNPLRTDPFPAPGSAGIYFSASNITATANPVVATGSTINWTFALTGAGNVGLGDFRQPAVKVFLDLMTGTASGQVTIAGLQVRFTTPTTFTINLLGSVGGISGVIAASDSHISPTPKNNYQINGCPISSVNCIKFTGLTVPVTNPLQDVQLGPAQDQADADAVLPDVAERDY